MFQGLHKLRKLDSQVKKNAEGGGSVKFYPLNDTCGAERNPFNAKDAGARSRRKNSAREHGTELDGTLEIARVLLHAPALSGDGAANVDQAGGFTSNLVGEDSRVFDHGLESASYDLNIVECIHYRIVQLIIVDQSRQCALAIVDSSHQRVGSAAQLSKVRDESIEILDGSLGFVHKVIALISKRLCK